MATTKADALQKRIEWTRGDIQDDRTELANALAALARTASEEARAFATDMNRTPSSTPGRNRTHNLLTWKQPCSAPGSRTFASFGGLCDREGEDSKL